MFTFLGWYLVVDLTLSLSILILLFKKRHIVRSYLRSFLKVPEACHHTCNETDEYDIDDEDQSDEYACEHCEF